MWAIASTLIYAVVLCEIVTCYPTILWRHTKSCAFSTIPIFPLFRSQNFLVFTFTFTCFAVLEESIQAGALLRPQKMGYLVWSRGASSARATHAHAQAQNIAAA